MVSSEPPDLVAAVGDKLNAWAIPRHTRVSVAFSGGADSTALLHALHARGQALQVLHVDHGWHPQSQEWAQYCRAMAADLGYACRILRVPLSAQQGAGPEDGARRARYGALAEAIAPGEFLLTGQHQDDQAETLLLQLLRGAGLGGLAAMPECRRLGVGTLGRPLLQWRRRALEHWLRSQHLDWLEDPANTDTRYARNRVRQQLLPLLADLGWPDAPVALARSAANLGDALAVEAAFYADLRQRWIGQDPSVDSVLPSRILESFSPSVQRSVLRQWLGRQGILLPDRNHLERLRLLALRGGGGREQLWSGGRAWMQGGKVRAWSWPIALPTAPIGPWYPGNAVAGTWGDWRWRLVCGDVPLDRSMPAEFAMSRQVLSRPLRWAHRQSGQHYRSASGQHRPVKKLLLELGMPPFLRDQMAWLWTDEGDLIWIPGFYQAPWAQAQAGEDRLEWR